MHRSSRGGLSASRTANDCKLAFCSILKWSNLSPQTAQRVMNVIERTKNIAVEEAASFAEAYWHSLSDEQLVTIVWSIAEPQKLPNLRTAIPSDLGEFQIENEYQLSPGEEPVRCGHCPGHTGHWHGYVLLDQKGHRCLLGSRCGPKAYGADYRAASKARHDAERRAEQLHRWAALKAELPSKILSLTVFQKSPIFGVVRRARRQLDNHLGPVVSRLRGLRPDPLTGRYELVKTTVTRDHAAEQRNQTNFMLAISELPILSDKLHNQAMAELRKRHQVGVEIIVTTEQLLGTLQVSLSSCRRTTRHRRLRM